MTPPSFDGTQNDQEIIFLRLIGPTGTEVRENHRLDKRPEQLSFTFLYFISKFGSHVAKPGKMNNSIAQKTRLNRKG